MAIHNNLINFFEELLSDIECQYDTRSYIISIYLKYQTSELDFSKDSVTLLYAQARDKHNFLLYQNLGDWIFFINTINNKNKLIFKEYYDTIAKLSYYSCYKLIDKKWKLFEELSDNLTYLEEAVTKKLANLYL